MKALQHWYKCKFEKLGWMILAKKHGLYDKITHYKSSIHRLIKAIEHKLEYHTHDADRKDDLRIMLNNVHTLKDHVDTDFE
jgi:hypothetical protein